jgi:GntR family transcriptional regulator, transcriptional repressor for pyruvate dehydrogenase complex
MVAAAIVEDIVSRDLKAGDRLVSEAEMVERFGVGRASIREGLRLLETYGVIDIRPGQKGGAMVAATSAGDFSRTLALFLRLSGATYQDVMEARRVIEPVMARLAAERQDQAKQTALRETMEEEATAPDSEYVRMSNEFHYMVAGASGNPVLDLLGQALRSLLVEPLATRGLFPPEARDAVRDVHKKIGQAILEGKAARAEKLMATHMDELTDAQAEKTPWLMNERVEWGQ